MPPLDPTGLSTAALLSTLHSIGGLAVMATILTATCRRFARPDPQRAFSLATSRCRADSFDDVRCIGALGAHEAIRPFHPCIHNAVARKTRAI
jgi:hypothetical protein